MEVPYPRPTHKPLTADQVKQKFQAAGQPVSAWAEANGYSRRTVYMVLSGTIKGNRGIAHEIAVQLGLKLDPSISLAA